MSADHCHEAEVPQVVSRTDDLRNGANDHVRVLLDCLALDERLKAYEHELRKRDQPNGSTLELLKGLLVYEIGFVTLGFSLGLFSGWSSSPVVATLLPILFGLLAATGGFVLTQKQLEKGRALAIGVSLCAFSIFCVVGGTFGISMRTGQSVWSLGPTFAEARSDLGGLAPDQALIAMAFRSRLASLGTDRASQLVLLTSLTEEFKRQRRKPEFQKVQSAFQRSLALLRKGAETAGLSAETTTLLRGAIVFMQRYSGEIVTWVPYDPSLAAVGYYQGRIEEIARVVKNSNLELSNREDLANTETADALWLSYCALSQEQALLSSAANVGQLLKAIEISGAAQGGSTPALRAPASEPSKE